ncbi:MAG: sulfate reduction electron transfer complex DsrMKJOP subunit DsrJ [Planctomycetota bacterium]|jgi:hypothetical protein
MYDGGKIMAGLAVFVVLATAPFWYNLGQAKPVPEVVKPAEGECVLPGEQMRHDHMQVLNNWRDEVVRDGARFYTHPDGVKREKSLTLTCLGCHTKKAEFCDRCHDYTDVTPYCWDCHIIPEEE